MYSATERMQKMLAAGAPTLARIDAILDGTDTTPTFTEQDCRTCNFTEAAKRLAFSRPSVYKLVRKGVLKTVELNGVRRIVLQSIFDYINGGSRARARVAG